MLGTQNYKVIKIYLQIEQQLWTEGVHFTAVKRLSGNLLVFSLLPFNMILKYKYVIV